MFFFRYIRDNFIEDISNVPLWFIAFYIFGIICYFSLNQEPSIILISGLTFCVGCIAYFTSKFRIIFLFLFSFLLGVNIIAYKASTIDLPKVTFPICEVETHGVIDQIYPLENGRRLILRNVGMHGVPELRDDIKIQVMIRSKKELSIGDKIKFIANLYSTKENFLPRGYDFARQSFFNKLIATGYAVSKIEVIGSDKLSIQNYIDNLRYYIFSEIKKYMTERTANVAAALMIGEQKSIDATTIDNMRKSGLSHILAVSGLHLSLLSIICFFVIRYCLSCFSGVCQRYNTKKIAAYFALIATFLYLLISGMHVSAVRAFIMVALVTLAVLIDREEDSKRSVCLAAFIILVCTPESLLTPSFQMSFAAVLALVSSYDLYLKINKNHSRRRNKSVFEKLRFYFFATAFSSFIAGSATAIFVIYTFNNYSNYSVLANVLVAPIVSIIIMPMVVLAFVLMPLKLHFIPLFILDYGINAMLKIAGYVSSLPSSVIILSKPDNYIIIIFLLGFLWLCFWRARWRIWGVILIISAFVLTIVTSSTPDIIIDSKRNILLVKSGKDLLKIGKKRLSKNYQSQLKTISKSNNIIVDKNKSLKYSFKNDTQSIDVNLYSQPIFDIYRQIKFVNIKNKDETEYLLDIVDLNKRGSCFIYLSKDKYKSECVLDNKTKRFWD